MEQQLTYKEIRKIQGLCFENRAKSCAIAQTIIDACQIVSCSTFAELTGKSNPTINYQADKLIGITIEGRKYIAFPQ